MTAPGVPGAQGNRNPSDALVAKVVAYSELPGTTNLCRSRPEMTEKVVSAGWGPTGTADVVLAALNLTGASDLGRSGG